MHTYAIGFLIAALGSACFILGAHQNIARLGKMSLGIFAALAIGFEVAARFA